GRSVGDVAATASAGTDEIAQAEGGHDRVRPAGRLARSRRGANPRDLLHIADLSQARRGVPLKGEALRGLPALGLKTKGAARGVLDINVESHCSFLVCASRLRTTWLGPQTRIATRRASVSPFSSVEGSVPFFGLAPCSNKTLVCIHGHKALWRADSMPH